MIRVVVVQPDGKILIGGDFTTLSPNGGVPVTRNRIARLNPDATLDTAFDPNADGIVWSIAVQADGKILVGGDFTTIGGQMRGRIARLDPATGLADSFNPNADSTVRSVAVQADGKILAGGFFSVIGGQTREDIARLDPTSGLADSFYPGTNGGGVFSIAVQADAKILVGGLFTSIGGQFRNRIARLDPASGLADSFDPNANNTLVIAIAVQADGKILAGGDFTSIGGQARNRIARLDASTGMADSFNPNPNNTFVYAIAVQADGKILAGGNFTNIGGQTRNRIARLNPTTGLADSFDPNTNGEVIAIAVQADGKILAGGLFTTLAPNGGPAVTRNRIARLETDGRLDRTLDVSVSAEGFVDATAVQPDGKILIGGSFISVLGVFRGDIARLNADGTLDTVFNPSSLDTVRSIVVQPDGKILVGGDFDNIGFQPRNHIARLDGTFGLADSFNPNANDSVVSIVVQADGKILVGGSFTGIAGQMRNYLARLNPDGTLDAAFNPNPNGPVVAIAVQADSKILVGGYFNGTNSIGGQLRNHIARLDPTTGLADSFDPNASCPQLQCGFATTVRSITVQPDGKIIAAGVFRNIGGAARNFVARLDPTTGGADSFDPNASGLVVYSIAVQADGKILAGGDFSSIGGQTHPYLARLDGTTGLADSFNPNPNNPVLTSAVQADGKILAGGNFGTIGGESRSRFARLSNDTAALQNLGVTQTAITWTRGGSSPQFTRVTFESSTDNVNYAPLGDGTPAGNNWMLTGLNLPIGQNIYIRARGYHRSGQDNGSESITESVRYGPAGPPVPTPSPSPTVTPVPSTPTPTPTSTPAATPTTLGNISTRLRVETGDNVLIGGFIVTGTQPKRIIVRAIGPSLPLAGVLADPVLELRHSSGGLIMSNDNWRTGGQEAEIIATTIPPSNDLESAIVATLPANSSAYTAIVRGLNNGTGIGVVEAYDLDQTVNSKLANISTRGFVQTGDDVLIGGLIVLGQNPLRVIVRAIGPSLPLSGALENPTLALHDGNGALLVSNDNWRDDPTQEAEIIATGIPPSNDLESAIVRNLAPGSYTAIVRGVNNTTGIAVVEAYGLN